MSNYSTGELAKECGVTVRTVQYYDKRGILVPCELSEGGRRIYSEDDAKKLKLICFLRDIGLSIDTIGDILAEPNSDKVLTTLLEQHAMEVEDSIREQNEKLKNTKQLMKEIQSRKDFSLDYINDIAMTIKGQKELSRARNKLILWALFFQLPFEAACLVTLIMIFTNGTFIPFAIAVAAMLTAAILSCPVIVPWYYKHVAYICPECHKVFKPSMKEFFWASHTPRTRKLTCTCCNHKGYSVEVYDENCALYNTNKKIPCVTYCL